MARRVICGIYMILNKVNNKVYIGQSVDIYKRWAKHKRELRNNKHDNDHLQKSWNRDGEQCFDFIILCECPQNKLNEMEQYYILCFNSKYREFGYNKDMGGKAKTFIRETTKKRLREANIGENSPVARKVYCIELDKVFNTIVEASEETNVINTSILSCCKHKYNYAGKLKDGTLLHWMYYDEYLEKGIIIDNTPKKKADKGHKVYCVELDKTFNELKQAGEYVGCDGSNIGACCRGMRKTAGGYHWVYLEEYEKNGIGDIDKNYIPPTSKRKVYCVELDMTFNSLQEASRQTGDLASKICLCCKGERKTTNKHHWRYIEE